MKKKILDIPDYRDVKEIIYYATKEYAEKIAFTIKTKNEPNKKEYKKITYKELLEQINNFGTSLYNIGLKKGKRIAVIGRNRYEWVVAHLTNLLGEIISVPLDKDLQLEELEESLIRSKVDAIVFDEKYLDKIEQIKKNSKTQIQHFISMGEIENYKNIYEYIEEGRTLVQKGEKEYIDCKIDNELMCELLFTSGTTSKSKAVMLSQKAIASNVTDMTKVEKLYSDDVNIAFLPFHHVFGSTCIIVMLSRGVQTVFTDGLRYIKQNLKEYKVSVFVGVPILVDKIMENIEKEIAKQGKTKLINFAKGLSNFLLKLHIDVRRKIFKQIIDQLGGDMRFIISGGAPLDKNTAKKFNEMGITLIQGYGLTETAPVIAAETDFAIKYGSIGIPLERMQLEIVNKDANGVGEIRVKGPNVMLGYYENEEATNKVLKDGWFYTGDLGYIDSQGFIFISGRQKDMIVLKNGKKVFPEELETLVNRIEEIDESFVYGMSSKDDENDLKISVKVVYNEKIANQKYNNPTEEELYNIIWNQIKEVNQTLPRYKYIKNMILTKEPLIKTTTNKIKRNEERAKMGIK